MSCQAEAGVDTVQTIPCETAILYWIVQGPLRNLE